MTTVVLLKLIDELVLLVEDVVVVVLVEEVALVAVVEVVLLVEEVALELLVAVVALLLLVELVLLVELKPAGAGGSFLVVHDWINITKQMITAILLNINFIKVLKVKTSK
jgi:hypothetical protein